MGDDIADMPEVFRTPDDRFAGLEGYPFEPHYVDVSADVGPLRMHYVDEGSGEPVVLVHGEPTWSYLYRKMIPPLAAGHRVIAPDHIGFGRSDKVTDVGWYSYDRHCDAFRQFLSLLDLRDVTLVVHDWGGPIGLRVATEEPDRIARLVVLNTGLYWTGSRMSEAWKAFRAFVEATPDLPIGVLVQGGTATDLPDDVIAGYEAPFTDAASKAGAVAFPLMVPMSDDDPGSAEMMRASEALERWDGPALVAFADSDPIFRPSVGEKLAARMPDATFRTIEHASHFLQEDAGEVIAGHIERFIAST